MTRWTVTTYPTGNPRLWRSLIHSNGVLRAEVEFTGTRRAAERDARQEQRRMASEESNAA